MKAAILGGSERKGAEILDMLVSSEGSLPGNAISPPYDFKKLYQLFEQSSILRPNVDAYVTNIESFGHHLVPTIDLAAKGAPARVANAMLYEAMLEAHERGAPAEELQQPSDEEVTERVGAIRQRARLEYSRLHAFFSFACPTFSFTELRRRTRQDLEVIGNAWWEITRNALGEVSHIYYVNPINVRLCPEDEEPTITEDRVRVTDVTWRTYKVPHYFRRYVKLGVKGRTVFFKEFGDPRTISRKTGKVYKTEAELQQKEPGALPATEMLHFAIYTPISPYGVPRWISNLPGVLGNRELEEVNFNYFKNNVVPPLALLVSGGRLGKGVATKIEEFIDEHLRGKKSTHRILVLEAESQKAVGEPGPRQVPRVMFVPLRDAQQTDALFQNYDLRNEEKVARCFRLPRILRGDDKQMNRATAYAAMKFAEEQVFEPERESFDSIVNRRLFPDIGIMFWLFRSNSPIVRDPEAMAEMVVNLVKIGVLTIAEGRELAADIFNKVFEEVSEDWTNKPLPFILAQLHTGATPEDLGIGTSPVPGRAKPAEAETDAAPGDGQSGGTHMPMGVRRAGSPLPAFGLGMPDERE